ncbi:MAG: NnrS family protein [Paracoccaceae bacterium]
MGGQPSAAACLTTAAIQAARMTGCACCRTRPYPALFMLHLAWVWVPVGLILPGVAMLRPDVMPQPGGSHALTMGDGIDDPGDFRAARWGGMTAD